MLLERVVFVTKTVSKLQLQYKKILTDIPMGKGVCANIK